MEITTLRKIQTVGNSLCIVLPRYILRSLNMQRGDQVVFRVYENDTIVMRKLTLEEIKIIKPDVIL